MIVAYTLFYILVLNAVASFVISLLWTYGYIGGGVLFKIGRANFTLRNAIDLWMIISRVLLPLPNIPQPRFEVTPSIFILGIVIYLVGVIFILSAVREIRAKLLYNEDINLVTTGVYSIVRHPIYFGDSIWPLGWSIVFGALYPSLFTILWLIFYIITTFKEEKELIRIYGERYIEYRKRVKRIIPYIL